MRLCDTHFNTLIFDGREEMEVTFALIELALRILNQHGHLYAAASLRKLYDVLDEELMP